MKWITAKHPGMCFDCCSSIWAGATVLLRGPSGVYCSPCGRSLERRLKEREAFTKGAFAASMRDPKQD